MRQLCEAVSTTALRVQAKQQVCQIPLYYTYLVP